MDKKKGPGINVLSLFDGSSCGQVALERSGIRTRNYFASEVDKWAEKIAWKNYPKTVSIGDVNFVSGIQLPSIDLILAGSPCQGFSFAGKQLAFDDPRSALFFEFLRVLEECRKYNPSVKFLLENVRMKQEHQDVISKYLGVQPVAINSSLVSAQNRYRLYWCNWDITQPEDKGILLKDVLVEGFGNQAMTGVRTCTLKEYDDAALCHHVATADDINGNDILKRVYKDTGKSPTLNTMSGGNREPKVLVDKGTYRPLLPIEMERLQTLPDNYTEGVSNTQRKKMLGNGWTVDVIAHILKQGEFV